jgi:ParB-like chromosome segregation protein Spo0J
MPRKKNRKSEKQHQKDIIEPRDLSKEPISSVEWVHRDLLKPNHYNPNHVAPPELELLIVSILEDGFTQPIVVLPDYTIVDGFHRYLVSGDKRLMQRYGGMVPVVKVALDPVHRMMSTIRHNRARGTHAVLQMAEIVRTMVAEGVEKADIMRRLGMEDEEVERLEDRAGMPEQVGRERIEFGKAWVPQG